MPAAGPFRQFSQWLRTAVARRPGDWFDPTAMTLATTDKRGHVTARIVLLKKFGSEGFTFFTNYGSRKGRQLAENPRAALVLYWPYLHRQIRIEGRVEQISAAESEAYFHSRPRLSQIAAAASNQSHAIISRKHLLQRFTDLKKTLDGQPVPLPKTWGGYRLIPDAVEFWHHRQNRLHDRVQYRKQGNGRWTVERLAP